MVEENLVCAYSGLPSMAYYMQVSEENSNMDKVIQVSVNSEIKINEFKKYNSDDVTQIISLDFER